MLNTIDNQTASTENTTTEGAAIEQVEGAQAEATTTEGEGSEQGDEEEEFVSKSKAEVDAMPEAERTAYLARLQAYFTSLTGAIEGAPSKLNQAEVNERTSIVKLFDSLKDHKVTMGEGQCAVKVTLKEALMGVKGVIYQLDGQPALDVLFEDLQVSLNDPQKALPAVRATLVGLTSAGQRAIGRTGSLGADVRVRHIIGLDPARKGIAIAEQVEAGERLAFCQMSLQAAKADLRRICAEIREELEPETLSVETANALAASEAEAAPHPARRIAGAVYVSCSGRGGPHFGGDSAELQWVRHALGDVPLVGFFANGEIAHHRLYGYTGVLTVFTTPAEAI